IFVASVWLRRNSFAEGGDLERAPRYVIMQDAREPAALRAALQYVLSNDIPSEHKAVLIEALTGSLGAEDSARAAGEVAEQRSPEWTPAEVQNLQSRLAGKVAKSWQDADEQLMQLAGELRRSTDDVRNKALEMGAGVGIDYRLAKERREPEDD